MATDPHSTKDDEESLLYIDKHKRYGATSSRPTDETSSRGSSDAEEPACGRLARRRHKRMLHHHQRSRPLLTSHLSNIIRRGQSPSSDDEDSDNNREPNLVLPSLDPAAQEVIASIPSHSSLDQWFTRSPRVNLSTVRAKYRTMRRLTRDEDQESFKAIHRFKQYIHYDASVQALKRVFFSKQNIVLFVKFDLTVDLLFCLAYLVEMKQESDVHISPPWLYKWRSYDLWAVCQLLSLWNFGSFIMRIAMNPFPFSVLLSFRCFLESITTFPFLASNFMEHGQYLYVPYFLRSWVLLLRLKSVMKIKTNLQMKEDKVVDPLKSKLIHLGTTLIALLYNGMAAFQYCEATFGSENYSILDSLYVVMVTLSTVGYGDITPHTEGSRIVMMLLIVISLAVLPGLLSDTHNTYRKRIDGGGAVPKSITPFILIVGTFRPKQANDILDGFLNRENSESQLNVVFLDSNPPTEELKLMERNSMWGHRVQFLHGSVLNDETLKRARASYAKAIFTISDQHMADPAKEDERNTVRLWSLYCYTVVHNIPIYTYNLSPSTAIYQKMAKEIICVREFKQYMLAMNCHCRGVSTLLTNLLHQRQPLNRYDEPWQAQYDDGSCNEIYMAPPAPCLIGHNFGNAAWLLYKECQIILFAIKATNNEGHEELLLNPNNQYTIKRSDLCVYLAESPKEIRDIEKLNSIYVWSAIRNMLKERTEAPADLSRSVHAARKKLFRRQPQQSTSSTSASTTSSKSVVLPKQSFKVARLPSTRHAMLTGSRALIARLGSAPATYNDDELEEHLEEEAASVPHCYQLKEPAKLEDLVIDTTEGMSGHILVCLHHKFSNFFKFIYNLRSPYLQPDELQDIVLLCMSLPEPKMFDLINVFPKVFIMVGNCRHPDDLLRAGVVRAKQVVVMSEKECLDQYERSSDSPAIMTSHLRDILLQEKMSESFRIVNLVEKSNVKFMQLLQGKDVAEEIDVFYTPAYAAGDVVVDSLISNVLLSQTYYKPDIVSVFKALLGMPSPSVSKSIVNHAPHLTAICMPDMFVNRTFMYMFETLLLQQGALPIGLLRAPSDTLGNELPFVYTNPVPSLILRDTDIVYLLSPPQ